MGGPYVIVERWAETFNEGEPSAVAALYALGATIWGTLAQSLTTSPDDIETYFTQAARAGLKVKLGEHVSSLISEASAIDTGHYEFSRTTDDNLCRAIQFRSGEAGWRMDDCALAFVHPAHARRRIDTQKGDPAAALL